MEKYLEFSKEEFQARADKARKIMEEQGLDACVFSKGSNITYFSGYLSYLFDGDFRPFFFVLPRKGEPALVVPELEKMGALRTSWCDNARTWGIFPQCEALDPITVLANALRDLGLSEVRVGFELTNGQRLGMTQQQLADLKALLPDMKVMPSDRVVWECRRVKSPAELNLLRKCGIACDLGCQRAVEAMAAGVSEKELEIAMCKGYLEGNGIPAFMTITSGPARNSMANPYASYNELKKGDMVVMDFGCKYDGYITDSTRFVFIEEVSDRGRELYEAVREIHDRAVEVIKPGIPVCAIQEEVDRQVARMGYLDLVLHRAGHALGREIHELPSIENNDKTILEAGMVLAVEPALYDASIGPVRMEDNIIVTETGYEYITNFSRELIVKK